MANELNERAQQKAGDRDPQQDPRVGDLLQVIPPFGARPSPMTVLSVSDSRVTWTRGQTEMSTDLAIWRAKRVTGGGERLIVFAEKAHG